MTRCVYLEVKQWQEKEEEGEQERQGVCIWRWNSDKRRKKRVSRREGKEQISDLNAGLRSRKKRKEER